MRKLILAFVLLSGPALAQVYSSPTFQDVLVNDGLVVGAAASGNRGAGTINATGYYLNGSPLSSIYPAGTAIGDVLGPLASYGGYPALQLSSRLMMYRPTPSATDNFDLWLKRQSTFSGGAGNTNTLLYAEDYPGANDASANNTALFLMQPSGSGDGVALYTAARRPSGTSAPVWAMIADVQDQTGLASSGTGGHVVSSEEFDYRVNKADDATNGDWYGGVGVRGALGLIFSRYNTADTTPAEVSAGLWIHSNTIGGTGADPYAYLDSAIAFGMNTQVRVGLDMRGAVAPTGSGSPVVAVSMAPGQAIDFAGPATKAGAPGKFLQYVGGRLGYIVGSTEEWGVADNGDTFHGGAVVAGTAFSNTVKITGAGPGSPVILTAAGSDTSIAVEIQGKGSSGALTGAYTRTADPTTTDIPAGFCADWNNTIAGTYKHVCNFGGTLRSVTMN